MHRENAGQSGIPVGFALRRFRPKFSVRSIAGYFRDRIDWMPGRFSTDDFSGSIQSVVEAAKHRVRTQTFVEPNPMESDQRLGMYARQQERRPLSMAFFVKLFQRVQSGCIDRRHTPHSQHENARRPFESPQRVLQAISNSEEKRSVDLVDLDARRDCAASDGVGILEFSEFFVGVARLAGDRADVRHLGHALHE